MPVDTIDTIKRRLIRNASKIWGYSDVQDINSFDPVLALIIGALAEELHNISRETEAADARVIDKLLEVIYSRNVFTHFPSHAVAHAKPLQPRVEMNDYYQFYYTKEEHGAEAIEGKTLKKNVFFSPTTNCTVFNGEIKYLFAGKFLFEIDRQSKEFIAEAPANIPGGDKTLLLGIQLDPLIEFLDGLSLFFSFKNIQSDDRFFHKLHAAKWKINGKEVVFSNKLNTGTYGSENSLTLMMKKESDISYRTSTFINDFYTKKFMILEKSVYRQKDFLQDNYEPMILKEYFQEQKTDIFAKDIIWIEIDFLQPILFEEVNDLIISMNSFPVINRELNEYTHSIVKGTNVIPLLTDDLFFDVKKVTDSRDVVYVSLTSNEKNEEEGNTFFIRQGGITRFDSRDAKETIKHLIDLVRDESAAFSIKGTDLITSELKELDQILSRLEQRIDTSGIAHDLHSYLILESDTEYDKIQVQFWSIAGEKANNIRPGSNLSVYKGIDLDEKSVALLTQTTGGRQKLSKEDKLNSLRRSLLSKGRVVTVEDIKALCFEVLGTNLKKVEVKKGVGMNSKGKGLGRTLDIYLYFTEGNELTMDELWHKTETLKVRLKQESVNLLPYRVFVK